jgi:hypothetical protein
MTQILECTNNSYATPSFIYLIRAARLAIIARILAAMLHLKDSRAVAFYFDLLMPILRRSLF